MRALVLVLVLLSAALLAACSGSDLDEGANAAPTTSTTLDTFDPDVQNDDGGAGEDEGALPDPPSSSGEPSDGQISPEVEEYCSLIEEYADLLSDPGNHDPDRLIELAEELFQTSLDLGTELDQDDFARLMECSEELFEGLDLDPGNPFSPPGGVAPGEPVGPGEDFTA